nr:hypothetical protein [Deltaproteobacteria bacterium]
MSISTSRFAWLSSALVIAAGCGGDPNDANSSDLDEGGNENEPQPPPACGCPGDNGGITLPSGFCATVFADDLGRARHMAVTPSGDVFVVIDPPMGATEPSHVIALRDADHDGVAE